ncbi:MAG: U32 family peptidase [Thermoplasmata archaeon]|nr:U32 family peptidase [Thermoplasmata archaeon]
MEILAPAGTPEGLAAAVKGGCDAVYLAGKSFGARAFAGNFSDRELEGAVHYAHDRGVKVHVAVNTSIMNRELDDAVSFVRFLKDIGADAVLVQDLGLLRSISSIDIPKHASTQMQIHSRKGLEWCAENGLDRAVLARELTFDELSKIVPDSPVETEVFIQGALCYCMSGGCLMSSFMGGRSGNRGSCAQPCRKRYTKDGETGFLLSCADLFGADYIEKLRGIGVDSLKIEGRMRSPAYAYLSTKVYSLAEDGDRGGEYEDSLSLLRTVFNRGTSEGYLPGVSSPVQPLYPDNRGFLLGRARIKGQHLEPIDFCDPIGRKDGLSIFDGDAKVGGFKVIDTDSVFVPFRIADGVYDIYRTYDPRIDDVKNLIGHAPKLNGSTQRRRSEGALPERDPRRVGNPDRSFYVSSLKVLDAVLPYADRVYYEWGPRSGEAADMCSKKGVECVTILPRFDCLDECHADGPVMVSTPSQLLTCAGQKMFAAPSFNVFNSAFPSEVFQATISVELSRNEVSDLAARYPSRVEVMAFGRTELMYSRDPGMGSGTLVDDTGASFPVYTDSRGFTRVLNSVDLFLLDSIQELGGSGVSSIGIDVRKRPPALAKAVAMYARKQDPKLREKIQEMCGGEFTQTLYRKGLRRE